jgi:hypothetical protein
MNIQKSSRFHAHAGAGFPFGMAVLAALIVTPDPAQAATCADTSTADRVNPVPERCPLLVAHEE